MGELGWKCYETSGAKLRSRMLGRQFSVGSRICLAVGAVAISVAGCVSSDRQVSEETPVSTEVAESRDVIRYGHIVDKAYFQSLQEMVAASDLVIVGVVVSVVDGPLLGQDSANAAETQFLQMASIVVEVDQVVHPSGAGPNTVTVESMGWWADIADGSRSPIVVDGLGLNRVGDRVIWFLEGRDRTADGEVIYEQVSLDGLLTVVDGRIQTDLVGEDRLANRLEGLTVDELVAQIRSVSTP